MGGQKVFTLVEGGSKSFGGLKRGVKKFDDENFQLPNPPHQSIYEHSLCSEKVPANLTIRRIKKLSSANLLLLSPKRWW